eukprot:m.362290 g.362290  ORF g.362290 m.362290 type:complete len:167 (+) comp20786_c1_seq2:126-626(+)
MSETGWHEWAASILAPSSEQLAKKQDWHTWAASWLAPDSENATSPSTGTAAAGTMKNPIAMNDIHQPMQVQGMPQTFTSVELAPTLSAVPATSAPQHAPPVTAPSSNLSGAPASTAVVPPPTTTAPPTAVAAPPVTVAAPASRAPATVVLGTPQQFSTAPPPATQA